MQSRTGTVMKLMKLASRSLSELQVDDVTLDGLDSPADLAHFYRGLAINRATYLSRVRTEATRIGSLRSFNDRQSVLLDFDENQILRKIALKQFKFPMNEKLLKKMKCAIFTGNNFRRLRLLFFENYVILDPNFYGPEIHLKSEVIRLVKFHSCAPGYDDNSTVVQLRLRSESLEGMDELGNVTEMPLTFQNKNSAAEGYHLLSQMCQRAEVQRLRKRLRPFDNPMMRTLMKEGGLIHQLKKADKMKMPFGFKSLYYVQSGEICLVTKQGDVSRIISEGESFGELLFALNSTSEKYSAEAVEDTTVLELKREFVLTHIGDDQTATARFFHSLSQMIEKDIVDALQESFPGSWNLQLEDHHGTNELTPLNSETASPLGGARALENYVRKRSKSPEGRRKRTADRGEYVELLSSNVDEVVIPNDDSMSPNTFPEAPPELGRETSSRNEAMMDTLERVRSLGNAQREQKNKIFVRTSTVTSRAT
mmetsp:Transcript_40297/g.62905  ORF Transcript_40297/g.62905 Transcript_40297/m.62905 type:complete len:481 (+) Transcript_40297:2-1444(+)